MQIFPAVTYNQKKENERDLQHLFSEANSPLHALVLMRVVVPVLHQCKKNKMMINLITEFGFLITIINNFKDLIKKINC